MSLHHVRRGTIAQTAAWLAVLGASCAAGVYFAPALLPVRIAEGPLVQRPEPNAIVVVWYLTRPAECAFTLDVGGHGRALPIETSGRRQRVRITDLPSAPQVQYEIRVGSRMLATSQLHPPPVPQSAAPVRFIVFGDSGMGYREQYLLAGQMEQTALDFLLHTGDLVYPDGLRRRYTARFFVPYRPLLARVPFWPSLGNHDVDKAGTAPAYTGVFELPENGPAGLPAEHDYWFDWGPLRCAVLDSNVDEATLHDRVVPWLRGVFGDVPPGVRWRFVVLHHPPYTIGRYAPPNAKTAVIHRVLPPVCDELGIDVVFSGHDHSYQHSRPLHADAVATSGPAVQYVITGAGGAALYARRASDDRIAIHRSDVHSFTVVALDGDRLDVRQVDIHGETIDAWSVTKGGTPTSRPVATSTAAP
jgi:hypothetical protein